jgi:hypothetical protein
MLPKTYPVKINEVAYSATSIHVDLSFEKRDCGDQPPAFQITGGGRLTLEIPGPPIPISGLCETVTISGLLALYHPYVVSAGLNKPFRAEFCSHGYRQGVNTFMYTF